MQLAIFRVPYSIARDSHYSICCEMMCKRAPCKPALPSPVKNDKKVHLFDGLQINNSVACMGTIYWLRHFQVPVALAIGRRVQRRPLNGEYGCVCCMQIEESGRAFRSMHCVKCVDDRIASPKPSSP